MGVWLQLEQMVFVRDTELAQEQMSTHTQLQLWQPLAEQRQMLHHPHQA